MINDLQSTGWDAYIEPAINPRSAPVDPLYIDDDINDKEQWFFYGMGLLYKNICVYLETKDLYDYLKVFRSKYENDIHERKKVTDVVGPRYSMSEPSLKMLREFVDVLSPFRDFDLDTKKKRGNSNLRQILENSRLIIEKLKVEIKNETTIYKSVKWIIELSYPSTRGLNKARFIKKFATYQPDILIPEIGVAIEYKYVKSGTNVNVYLDQIRTDSLNYTFDIDYNHFYAIVYFEDKSEFIPSSFAHAVKEKGFPENWEVIGV